MAFTKIENIAIKGVSACVPKHVEENADIPVFAEGEAERVIAQTSIRRKHTVVDGMTASDLCEKAFNGLISELGWDKDSIDIVVLVTSSSDYLVPPTACVLHGKLELPETTFCLEIRHGCPGWVIGLTAISSLMSNGCFKRGILLCGDCPTLQNSPRDKETRPLFGDAGTATALEYDPNADAIYFNHGTNGKDFMAIYQPDGGMKNPVTNKSLEYQEFGRNQERRPIDVRMDGMSVFSFGFSKAPRSVKALSDEYGIDLEAVDIFLIHQANHYLNEKVRKKLNVPESKVPYSMQEYGNPGSSSIPLTLVTQCRERYRNEKIKTIAVGFGVGLAWGSAYFTTDKIVCPPIYMI